MEEGKVVGIFVYVKKAWFFICYKVIRLLGSTTSILEIKFLRFVDACS